MKSIRTIVLALFLMSCSMVLAQLTPEQKKQIEEAKKEAAKYEKQVEEYAKQAEKMLNSPEMKQMMEQLKALESQTKTKTEPQTPQPIPTKSNDDYYWQYRIASNTNGFFKGWSFGKVNLKISYYNLKDRKTYYLNVGNISDEGQVTLNLPELDFATWKNTTITEQSKEGDDLMAQTETFEFSDRGVSYFSTIHNLSVYKADEYLGILEIGNAIKPVVHLNSMWGHEHAGDGYKAYWIYMSAANSIKGSRQNLLQLSRTGEKAPGKVMYDLNFKAGWNLVIQTVEGKRGLLPDGTDGNKYWLNNYVTTSTLMPEDAKYYFRSDLIAAKR